MKLGSLFDGSGGFPLAGTMCGITPVWASEIEAYPIRVTSARFPGMKHLGDITKLVGSEIEPVDVITFGSPCQDLSVAGKRAGIHEGARSSLFFHAIRIIKEMREATNGVYPRIIVWENVHGAYSSNGGEDFRAVLQALCEIADPDAHVPRPEKGKWRGAGCIVGDGYSVAWRTYDAQYWGVPQRRRRIYLVADFGSERAGEILFERESVRGNPAQSREAREGTAADAEGSASGSSRVKRLNTWDAQSHRLFDVTGSYHSLYAAGSSGLQDNGVVYCLQGNGIDRAETAECNGCGWRTGGANTLNTIDRHAIAFDCRNMAGNEEISGTLQAKNEGGFSLNFINPIVYDQQRFGQYGNSGTASSLKARDYKDATDLIVYADRRYIVRRLTPLECCRLQGFPDWWEDGVQGSDSARYKMWGNGIALPCAYDVMSRVKRLLEEAMAGEKN